MKQLKIHLPDKSKFGHAVCGFKGKGTTEWLSDDMRKVTCGRCLLISVNKTYAGVNQEPPVDVVVRSTGPNFINFIKAVRELSSLDIASHHWSEILRGSRGDRFFGLKESKDFADAVREGASPLTLVTGLSRAVADNIRLSLINTGAVVTIEGKLLETGVTQEQLEGSPIWRAWREMLALFVPDLKDIELLDQFHDDAMWPQIRQAKVGDVKRWLAAGGVK